MVKNSKSNGASPITRTKYPVEFKLAAIKRVRNGETAADVGGSIRVPPQLVRKWARTPTLAGQRPKPGKSESGVLIGASGRKMFSEEYKRRVVERAQSGKETVMALQKELGIASPSLIYSWIKRVDERKQSGIATTPKQVNGVSHASNIKIGDAIRFLKHAKTAMYTQLQDGVISEFDEYHMYVLMALKELQKSV